MWINYHRAPAFHGWPNQSLMLLQLCGLNARKSHLRKIYSEWTRRSEDHAKSNECAAARLGGKTQPTRTLWTTWTAHSGHNIHRDAKLHDGSLQRMLWHVRKKLVSNTFWIGCAHRTQHWVAAETPKWHGMHVRDAHEQRAG